MKPKYKVRLCRCCIELLDEEFSYTIPRDQLEIEEVPPAECDNEDLDNYNEKLRSRNPEWEE